MTFLYIPAHFISHEQDGYTYRAGAGNHPALAPALKADFPEIEVVTRISSSIVFVPATTVSYEPPVGFAYKF